MIRVVIVPRGKTNLYSVLTKKERDLRSKRQGTLHTSGRKKRGEVKWVHKSYPGWIRLAQCPGGIAVAVVQSKQEGGENLLFTSFVGFLDRHFSSEIASITISYEWEE